MTTITRYSKPQKRSSKFTQQKAAPSAIRFAEEVKAYRKAKLAFRVYASRGDFTKALDELMKLNEITLFSQHPDGFCFSKYPGRWTQGMLKLIPAKELIDFRCKRTAEICFGNIKVIDSYLKQQRHKVVYNLIASKKLKVNRKQLSSYIRECLARQHYVYHICLFPDWEIKVNWVEQTIEGTSGEATPEGEDNAN